jgi:FtsP/CotA-like multicopper oxidase with cupredoxin domain
VLSDWTNENPMSVLRFLKRGTEWYNWRKGTATPLNQVIARGALGAQLNFWRQRMESADIADIYYPALLVNGEQKQEYPDFKPDEKVRLRIINGAASTQFWMTFGGGNPTIVSADGLNVEPVAHNKTFIAIAETYDFIVTIPEEGKMEFKITAQDGSGTASAFLGQGEMLPAPAVPRPDKIAMMKQMSKMDMRMGAPALKFRPKKVDPEKMMRNWGMQMKDGMSGMNMDNTKSDISMHQGMDMKKDDPEETKMSGMGDDKMMQTSPPSTNMESAEMGGMNMFSEYNYDYLKSTENTTYSEDVPVKEILLNLTGNMSRYIWSMNGIPLAETDKIKINEGEVTRITFNNLTMMHHPMHLHGHFFRVINENGDYSPLKHTVNVPPMQKVTIEFYGNEYGDWFFHCHILYHMMGGMARVVSYDTPEDPRMKPFPISKLIHETNRFYSWGMADVASHNTTVNLTTSNIRNQFNLSMDNGWNQNLEAEFSYEYYLYDYLRVFGGVNVENTTRNSLDEMKTIAVAGIRWFTPYMFSVDLRVDNELRPRIGIGRSLMVFPKLSVFGYYEYQIDAGWVNSLEAGQDYKEEIVWSAGAQYMLSKNFSLMTSYDNRFGAGAGLSVMF